MSALFRPHVVRVPVLRMSQVAVPVTTRFPCGSVGRPQNVHPTGPEAALSKSSQRSALAENVQGNTQRALDRTLEQAQKEREGREGMKTEPEGEREGRQKAEVACARLRAQNEALMQERDELKQKWCMRRWACVALWCGKQWSCTRNACSLPRWFLTPRSSSQVTRTPNADRHSVSVAVLGNDGETGN